MRFGKSLMLGILIVGLCGFSGFEPRLEKNDQRRALEAMTGKVAPALNVKDWINSQPIKLDELKGKVVVLEFWATWCTTCIGLVPHHNDLMKKYGDKGLVFIGICDAEGAEKMPEVARRYEIRYPIAVDAKNATSDVYKADSTPDFYLIDRQGKLRWADIVTDDVDRAIETLIGEK